MKKVIIFITICSVYFIAWKDAERRTEQPAVQADTDTLSTDTDTLSNEEWKKYPEVDEKEVKKMADHYKTLVHNIRTNIMRMITMDGPWLRKILREQARIRLIAAAYLMDNSFGKKGDATIIIQLISKKSGKKVYYDMNSIFLKKTMHGSEAAICPPPQDCEPTQSD